ncbi:hypothetical protein SCA6_008306 [Theobroma cacao]
MTVFVNTVFSGSPVAAASSEWILSRRLVQFFLAQNGIREVVREKEMMVESDLQLERVMLRQ